jgi:HSP20 family protein
VPGVAPEDVSITVDDGVLTVEGERKLERKERREDQSGDESTYHVVERRYGRFLRRFTLPRQVDTEHVTAQVDRGVLTIVLPKAAAAKPRRIAVNATNATLGNGPKGVREGNQTAVQSPSQQRLGEAATAGKARSERQTQTA